MNFLKIKVTTKGALGMGKRQWAQEILKPAMYQVGLHWRQAIMPRRFDARQHVYGFRERTEAWKRAKRKDPASADGGRFKLVYTGDARSRASSGNITARATSNKQSVKIAGPRKLNFRPKTKGSRLPIDMREEFRAVTGRDVRALQTMLRKSIREGFVKVGKKVTFRATITK